MLKPALDEENRTVVSCCCPLSTQYNINTYQEQWATPEIIQPKQVTVVGRHRISKGIEERGNSRGQLKTKWNFQRSVHEKVMWNDLAVIRKIFCCLV